MIAYAIHHAPAPASYRWSDAAPSHAFAGPDREDCTPRPHLALDDAQEALLADLCAGRSRLTGRITDEADDLAGLGLARCSSRGWRPTAAGRELVGPVPQRWPSCRMPRRGRHTVARVVRGG